MFAQHSRRCYGQGKLAGIWRKAVRRVYNVMVVVIRSRQAVAGSVSGGTGAVRKGGEVR